MEKSYRVSVIESLKKIFKDKSYSNIVINNDVKNIDRKYYALYRKSVLGVVENLIYIDWVINQTSKTKTKKMEMEVLIALRLAVYQLFFLDNSHESIVVNESVQYIKDKVNVDASKFVNAVLRNIIRSKTSIIEKLSRLNTNDRLSIQYSYPKSLVEMWAKEFGKNKVEEVLIANNSEAPLNIRVNNTKIFKEELKEKLYNKGIFAYDCELADKGLIIENPFEIEKTEEYKNGLFSIQSECSILAGQILAPNKGSLIIDLCAAPGGKSFNASELMDNTGTVISRDVYKQKISLMENDIKRLGLKNIKAELSDATVFDENLENKADYCIADVPCTGLGIIRRKPEIKYNKPESYANDLSEIQYKIIENAGKYLKRGGIMVYSTCTVLKQENIDIVNKFLVQNNNFELVDISKETKGKFDTASKGYIQIYPHVHNMDGFFIAKIRKC